MQLDQNHRLELIGKNIVLRKRTGKNRWKNIAYYPNLTQATQGTIEYFSSLTLSRGDSQCSAVLAELSILRDTYTDIIRRSPHVVDLKKKSRPRKKVHRVTIKDEVYEDLEKVSSKMGVSVYTIVNDAVRSSVDDLVEMLNAEAFAMAVEKRVSKNS